MPAGTIAPPARSPATARAPRPGNDSWPGQGGDSPMFPVVMGAIQVQRLGGGRARTRPDAVMGNKTYSSRANRSLLRG